MDGIGEKTEKRLWEKGILTWNDFVINNNINFISGDKKEIYNNILSKANIELEKGNAEYFASAIKRREHWRLFEKFKNYAVCLDIETNGYMPDKGGYVTVVGLYNGYDYKCFVRGINLDETSLKKEIANYRILITYFGTGFDVPFLLRTMKGLRFYLPHFDTCFCSKKVGYKGGLKKLEAALGIERDQSVQGMNGYDAVKLWEYYCQGSNEALDLLVLYNKEDTVNLFKTADILYRKLKEQTGINEYIS
ncbi:MAG: ribonuclease H-like domain-containing protein [Nitrospirae bacterium]|nr:ribonuclease H-like domain-containing protein [Nitrospirota bacterium]